MLKKTFAFMTALCVVLSVPAVAQEQPDVAQDVPEQIDQLDPPVPNPDVHEPVGLTPTEEPAPSDNWKEADDDLDDDLDDDDFDEDWDDGWEADDTLNDDEGDDDSIDVTPDTEE